MDSSLRFALKLRSHGFGLSEIPTFLEFRQQMRDCQSVLDVGCGKAARLRVFGFERLVGVEAHEPSFREAKANQTHDELVLGDARRLLDYFQPNQFDACIAIDVIEHLTPEEGISMAKAMETVSRQKSILFTPNGFLQQQHTETDDLQHHFSGWEPREMERLGYQVTGMLGPRRWRGEYHILKHRPKVLWGFLSLLAHYLWTRRHPNAAAALLCVKTKAPTRI